MKIKRTLQDETKRLKDKSEFEFTHCSNYSNIDQDCDIAQEWDNVFMLSGMVSNMYQYLVWDNDEGEVRYHLLYSAQNIKEYDFEQE